MSYGQLVLLVLYFCITVPAVIDLYKVKSGRVPEPSLPSVIWLLVHIGLGIATIVIAIASLIQYLWDIPINI